MTWNGVKKCFVPVCLNNSIDSPQKYFFTLPRSEKRRKEWLDTVNLPFKKTTRFCCEDHFNLEKDCTNYLYACLKGKPTLRRYVVPHLFLCTPNPDIDYSQLGKREHPWKPKPRIKRTKAVVSTVEEKNNVPRMPQPKKKKTREEILAQKRENERKRYERMKNNPDKLEILKEKKKEYYLMSRTTGKIKTISEMTEREKRRCRKSWRTRSSKYYKKKCDAKETTTHFTRATKVSSSRCPDIVCQPSTSQIVPSPLQGPSARNRENARKRYERIKNNPDKLAILKEKKRQYYLKSKITGKIKTIFEMTEREKRRCRKLWRTRSNKYYKKICAAKKSAIEATTSSSLCSEDLVCQPSSSQILQEPSASQPSRLRVARQKCKRNKEIKEKDGRINKLQGKAQDGVSTSSSEPSNTSMHEDKMFFERITPYLEKLNSYKKKELKQKIVMLLTIYSKQNLSHVTDTMRLSVDELLKVVRNNHTLMSLYETEIS
ncbi:axoneme-associated protein mst101(2) isoform X2 [Aethina tumida]|uniref:axoneme-associated protein mst101(2) isoform X2 n=1 Tax=Aethina tumida TaxID=116153 RepID=UPI00214902A2|nr:axoneme-associated protein mst101(2) isoform X2 [Aethina tumida]